MATYLSPGVYVEEKPSEIKPIAGVGTSTGGFIGFFGDDIQIPKPNPKYDPTKETKTNPPNPETPRKKDQGSPSGQPDSPPAGEASDGNKPYVLDSFKPRPTGEVVLCTNFTEFKQAFGDFSTDPGQRNLAHGVYGFFQNGGTRCWVAREKDKAQITHVLGKFEGIDEIALVAAPGVSDQNAQEAILNHCEKLGERFAILDTPQEVGTGEIPEVQKLTSGDRTVVPRDSNYGAV